MRVPVMSLPDTAVLSSAVGHRFQTQLHRWLERQCPELIDRTERSSDQGLFLLMVLFVCYLRFRNFLAPFWRSGGKLTITMVKTLGR